MFRLLFWKDATKRAEDALKSVQSTIVCMFCGDGAVPAFRGGYLVRYGFAYRHSSPAACALVVARKRAEKAARSNFLTRLWVRLA